MFSLRNKIISTIVTLSMLTTVFAPVCLADDIPSDWARGEVERAQSVGLVTQGVQADYQKDITREEFCALVVKLYASIASDVPQYTASPFEDTDSEDVAAAYELGIVAGISDTVFAPDVNITRQEMSAMLVRCIDAAIPEADVSIYPDYDDIEDKYSDAGDISPWAFPSVSYVLGNDIMRGISTDLWNDLIKPLDNTTCEQAILLILRVYENKDKLAENNSSHVSAEDIDYEEISEQISKSDLDNDGLYDEDELDIYDTDPKKADTDGDGADDGWEVFYGTDPTVPDRSFEQTKSTDEVNKLNPIGMAATADLTGEQVGSFEIEPVVSSEDFLLSPTIPGYMGNAFEVSVDGELPDDTEATFTFDDSLGSVGDDFQPRVYLLDEETSALVELPNQHLSGNSITVTITRKGRYILLNKIDFDLAWASDIRKPAAARGKGGSSADLDIVFVIDESSSMESNKNGTNNDPDRIRIDAAKNFVDEMTDGDRAAVLGFSEASDVRNLCDLTYDMDEVKTQIDNIVGNSGGTALYAALNKAVDKLDNDGRSGADKIVIALTDGEDDPAAPEGSYDDVIDNAQSSDVTIYTVGLGEDIATTLLVDIAESTGGKYFHADVADDLYQSFELVKDETIDYKNDSNNDGISDYYTRLIFDGTLRMSNGSAEFMGTDLSGSADFDGDGLLNGEEIQIIEVGNRVMARFISDPTIPDSDHDFINDADDPHPLRPDYLSSSAADFRKLTDDSGYQYTHFADEYTGDFDNNFGEMLADATVATLTFTDVQQEYTNEMAEFFVENLGEERLEYSRMLEMNEVMACLLNQEIAGEIDMYTSDISALVLAPDGFMDMAAAEQKTRLLNELGEKVIEAKRSYSEAQAAARSTRSIAAQKAWITRHENNLKAVSSNSNVGVFLKQKGFSDKIIKSYNKVHGVLESTGKVLDAVFLAVKVWDTAASGVNIHTMAEGIAELNANTSVISNNAEVLYELSRNGNRQFTRSAAEFMLDSIMGGYGEVMSQIAGNAAMNVMSIGLDLVLMAASGTPIGLAVSVGFAVFNIVSSAAGWTEGVKTKGRLLCMNDISDVLRRFVDRYYLYDDYSLPDPTHTEGIFVNYVIYLSKARIRGETLYKQLNTKNTSAADNSIKKVNSLLEKWELEI